MGQGAQEDCLANAEFSWRGRGRGGEGNVVRGYLRELPDATKHPVFTPAAL